MQAGSTRPRTTQWDLHDRLLEASAIADLNRDGHLDLVFPMSYGDQSEIVWGGPDGYGPGNHLLLEAHGAAHAVPADLDRDGWLDLLFTSSASPRYRDMDGPALIYWGSPGGLTAVPPTPLEGFTSLDASIADFNEDGHLDIALTNYKSATTREIPAFVYWGDGSRNYSKARRTLVKAASSSAVDSLDLDRDGWVDLVVSNHQTFFDHAAGTNIYWGSEEGFASSNRSHLPTVGVHLDAMVDAGNVYTREPKWGIHFRPGRGACGNPFQAPALVRPDSAGDRTRVPGSNCCRAGRPGYFSVEGARGIQFFLFDLRRSPETDCRRPCLAPVPGDAALSRWRQLTDPD